MGDSCLSTISSSPLTLPPDVVILDVFARGRNKESWRDVLRLITRLGTGALRLLIASIYLRGQSNCINMYSILTMITIESVCTLLTLFPNNLQLSSRLIMTVIFAIILVPLSTAQSLAAKRIIIATWVSVATYVLWLGLVAYVGTIDANPSQLRMGVLWQGISCVISCLNLAPLSKSTI
jgi:hypothetical protein